MEKLKRKYPNPQPVSAHPDASSAGREGYCIGGAFYMESLPLWTRLMHYIGWANAYTLREARFPLAASIARALRRQNHSLNEDTATMFAGNIVLLNDAGKFECAWIALQNALSYDLSSAELEKRHAETCCGADQG